MAKIKISKQEKIEGLLLIIFLVSNVVFFLLKRNDLVLLSMSLIVIVLLVLWIKNAKTHIEKNNRQTYNTLMYILSVYSRSTSLIAFSFRLLKLPLYKEIFLVAIISIWVYIIVSLINKEYRNALWGVIYKIAFPYFF